MDVERENKFSSERPNINLRQFVLNKGNKWYSIKLAIYTLVLLVVLSLLWFKLEKAKKQKQKPKFKIELEQ